MKKLYLPIGISGAGKSTYLKKHFKPEVIISPDDVRRELTGNVTDQSKDAQIWMYIVPQRINAALNTYGEAVLDATNTNSRDRTRFLKNFGNDVETTAILFGSNPEVSKARVKKDIDTGIDRSAVPDEIIDKQYRDLMNGFENIKHQFDKVITVDELKESPDDVVATGNEYDDDDAFAFGYYNGIFRIKNNITHYDIFRDVYTQLVAEYGKDIDEEFRKAIAPCGRAWQENKVISFWYYPTTEFEKKQVIYDIVKTLGGKREEWRIESSDGELLPYSKFITHHELSNVSLDAGMQHVISPLKKAQRDVPAGWGSKFEHEPEWMKPMKEWADTVEVDGEYIAGWDDWHAYPFGIPYDVEHDINNLKIGSERRTHGSSGLELSAPDVPSGRIWTDKKIIGFWTLPKSTDELRHVVDVLNNDMKSKGFFANRKIDDKWQINLSDHDTTNAILIPIFDFSSESIKDPVKYKQELEKRQQQHILSPLKKARREVPAGLGSKKVHEPEWMSIMKEQEEPKDEKDIPAEIAKKSINDEFTITEWNFVSINKAIEKANKALRARGMKELGLKILKQENKKFQSGANSDDIEIIVIYTVKIEGDVPDVHDYEFIAKIEHTEVGNIINMNPNIPPEKLPSEYKTSTQRCDICKTQRDRYNTFIIRKVETGEYICAGSTCLKKFMPLDAVKAFLELAIQLEAMRNMLTQAEAEYEEGEGGGGWGSRAERYLDPEQFLTYMCIAYFSKGKFYISSKKARELSDQGKYGESTLSVARDLMTPKRDGPRAAEYERERVDTITKYKAEANDMAKKILAWMQEQDFDQMALDNPNMETYFNNMKVLSKLSYVTPRNLGYYSSFLALYLRATRPKMEPGVAKKESEYVGTIGQKLETEVELKSFARFEGTYGTTTVYNFIDNDGNKLVWFSTGYSESLQALEGLSGTGKKVKIKGTVKAQQINKKFQNKETILTRVKITELPKEEPQAPQQLSEGFREGERIWIMMSDSSSPYDSGTVLRYNKKMGEYEVQADNKGNIFLLYEKDMMPYTNEDMALPMVRRKFMKISEIRTMVNEELNKVFEQSPEEVPSFVSPKASDIITSQYLITLPNNSSGIQTLKLLKAALGDVYNIKVRGRHDNRREVLGAKYRPGRENVVPVKLAKFWAIYLYLKH